MKAKRKSIGSRIVERLTRFTQTLERGDDLSKRFTCREITLDLPTGRYGAALVRKTRAQLGVSQALFAQFLGVSLGAVRAWEQGVTDPQGVARRFMDEIRHDPEHWAGRLRQVAVEKIASGKPGRRSQARAAS